MGDFQPASQVLPSGNGLIHFPDDDESLVAGYHVLVGRVEQDALVGKAGVAVDEKTQAIAVGWIHVIGRRKHPPLRGEEESMVAKMVVAVAYGDIESHTPEELPQIPFYITAVLENEVDDVEIAIPSGRIAAVGTAKECHRGGKMPSAAVGFPVETLREENMMPFVDGEDLGVGNGNFRLTGQQVTEVLPQGDIVVVVP